MEALEFVSNLPYKTEREKAHFMMILPPHGIMGSIFLVR